MAVQIPVAQTMTTVAANKEEHRQKEHANKVPALPRQQMEKEEVEMEKNQKKGKNADEWLRTVFAVATRGALSTGEQCFILSQYRG